MSSTGEDASNQSPLYRGSQTNEATPRFTTTVAEELVRTATNLLCTESHSLSLEIQLPDTAGGGDVSQLVNVCHIPRILGIVSRSRLSLIEQYPGRQRRRHITDGERSIHHPAFPCHQYSQLPHQRDLA